MACGLRIVLYPPNPVSDSRYGERKGAVTYSMAGVGMPAFSLFFMQPESFLAHRRSLQDERKTSNCHTLFGMAKIPTDATIRSLLDPLHPSQLQGPFDRALAVLRERGGMKAFERLGGRTLIVFDGTEYFLLAKARLRPVPDAPAQ